MDLTQNRPLIYNNIIYPEAEGSREGMKQRGFLIIGLLLTAVYYFLVPRGSGPEFILRPESLQTMNGPAAREGGGSPSLGIHSGGTLVYLDSGGETLYRQTGTDIALGDRWWASLESEGVAVREPDGRLRARIPLKARPVARGGSLYLHRSRSNSLAKVDPSNGRIIWLREFLFPVTVLDSRRNRTLVGFIDGRCILFDAEGRVVVDYRPGGSRIEAIYGAALSDDASRIALIAGLDPQRFILLEERRNGFRPVSHHTVPAEHRRFVPVRFIRDDTLVLYDSGAFLTASDTADYSRRPLETGGSPGMWTEIPDSDILAMVGTGSARSGLRVLTRRDRILFAGGLPGDFSDIAAADNRIYLVGENRFAVMRFEQR